MSYSYTCNIPSVLLIPPEIANIELEGEQFSQVQHCWMNIYIIFIKLY